MVNVERNIAKIWRLGIACLLLFLSSTGGAVSTETKASEFVNTLGQEAIAIASRKEQDAKARNEQFRELLLRGFALKGVARFALGRYWRVATEAQQERYLKLFKNYVVNTYARRFDNYAGQSFDITGERDEGKKGISVFMQFANPKGPPIKLKWRVKKSRSTGNFKIIDLVIENVSMSVTQRSDFATAIANHGGKLDLFLDDLEAKAKETAAPASK